eukprot:scaffold47363_cov19-Tisochrysis_lutea.AAC.1
MQHVAEHAPVPACLPAAYLALGMQHVAHVADDAPMHASRSMMGLEACSHSSHAAAAPKFMNEWRGAHC